MTTRRLGRAGFQVSQVGYMAVGDGRGLPEELVSALKAHRWDRNFSVAA